MLNSKLIRSALSLILVLVLVFSLGAVSVFADEASDDAATETEVVADGATAEGEEAEDKVADDVVAEVEESETEATADDVTEEVEDAEDEIVTDGATATESETVADDDHDHDHDEEEAKEGMSTFDIVSLAILAALIVAGVIYCLKNKEKVGKFLRSLKSEFKKISWSSWRDVRKNTIVVLIVVIAVAILIGVVDVLFSKGIIALDTLIG